MERLETALMTVVWHTILERFNATSLSLQKVDIDMISAVKHCDSLVTFLLQLRDRFDETEEMAKSYVEIQEYKEATKHTKWRKRFFDESSAPDTELTARDQFRADVFYRIVAELRKRMGAYSAVHKMFFFLTE